MRILLLLSPQRSDGIRHEVMKIVSDMMTMFVQLKQKTSYINILRNYHYYYAGSQTLFIINNIIADEDLDERSHPFLEVAI